jgi:hypothetical protein
VPEVDDDQLAALRRLRVAFGPIEVVEVVRHDPVVSTDPEDDWGGADELGEGARMADPRRMTPEEHGQAHALLVRAVTDPNWQAAGQALDDLMRKLLVLRRLLEAEERLPKREPPTGSPMQRAAVAAAVYRLPGPPVRAVSCLAPGGSRPL